MNIICMAFHLKAQLLNNICTYRLYSIPPATSPYQHYLLHPSVSSPPKYHLHGKKWHQKKRKAGSNLVLITDISLSKSHNCARFFYCQRGCTHLKNTHSSIKHVVYTLFLPFFISMQSVYSELLVNRPAFMLFDPSFEILIRVVSAVNQIILILYPITVITQWM